MKIRERGQIWAKKRMPGASDEERRAAARGYEAGHRAAMNDTREDRFLARLYEQEVLLGHDPRA
ncbi:MAG: hypothetical protein ACYC63_20630 [Armatimonadota bacterium]